MRVNVLPQLVLALVLASVAPAFAQEKGQVGVSMGFPASFGLTWHITDTIAIRPDFGFSFGTTESTTEPVVPGLQTGRATTTAESRTTTFGLSALFFVHRNDNLRLYVSPRVAWSDLQAEVETEVAITALPPGLPPGIIILPPLPTETETEGSSITAVGSFGAQYSLGRRFAVFGEFGISYSDQETTSETSRLSRGTSHSHTWGTRGGVGVVFYF